MKNEKKELRRAMNYLRSVTRMYEITDYDENLISEKNAAYVGLSIDEVDELRSKYRIILMLDYLMRKISELSKHLSTATIDMEDYNQTKELIWRMSGAVRDVTYIIENDFEFSEDYYELLHD